MELYNEAFLLIAVMLCEAEAPLQARISLGFLVINYAHIGFLMLLIDRTYT